MFDRIGEFIRHQRQRRQRRALLELKARYHAFRIFLENNSRALELIVALDGRLSRLQETELRPEIEELAGVCSELVDGLNLIADDRYAGLYGLQGNLAARVLAQLERVEKKAAPASAYCASLADQAATDPTLFGNKAASLARLRRLGLPVPDGFACSTAGCHHFLAAAGLAGEVSAVLARAENGELDLAAAAERVREMILVAPLPPALAEAFRQAYEELQREHGGAVPAVSVRSSGVAEDGRELSFAGQYVTVLNVQDWEGFTRAYREVVAGGFSARAISYRRNASLPAMDPDLAVICQVMVEPDCAGVLFTHDPSAPDSGRMVISAVPGLGSGAVGGSVPVDIYRPPRLEQFCVPDFGIIEYGSDEEDGRAVNAARLLEGASIAHKTVREVAVPGGGVRREAVPVEKADMPLLSVEVLDELTRLGEIIESLERSPQDVEWAWSENGGLSILQARPLRLSGAGDGRRLRYPVISTPLVTGICASAGQAVGRVRAVHSAAELQQLQSRLAEGLTRSPSILVLPQSIVDGAPLVKDCAGLIIDIGNPTDHLSCVAREYGVPMITGAENALACLREGDWIILDAEEGSIFKAPESVRGEHTRAEAAGQAARGKEQEAGAETGQVLSPERSELRRLIVPLNLTDAYGSTFSFRDCRSLHDVIRFTHEMAVLSMFAAGDRVMEEAGGLLHPLEIGIPFSFLVIDLGGAIRQGRKKTLRQRLSPRSPLASEDILSVPLLALCRGLTTPELSWHAAPDAEAMPGILSRTMLDARSRRPAGSFNYALAARDYLNLNARMEFHFTMLDAVCGRDSQANYIRFRFKGGGAGSERSRRRARFLQLVLEANAFYTTVAGDLVTASLTGAAKETVEQRLVMLGRLFGYSRFLDAVMTDERVPQLLAERFLAGDFSSRRVATPEEEESDDVQA